MKINIFLIIAIMLFSFISCDEESEINGHPETPETVTPNRYVINAFNQRFPDVQDVEWLVKNDYYVANFRENSWPAVAWFDEDGEWLLEQIGTSHEDYQHIVSNIISGTDYAGWWISDAQTLDRKGFSTVHIVGLENDNEKSNFYFTKYGDLIKIVSETNQQERPVIIPNSILSTINSLFDNPEFVDITGHYEIITEVSVGVLDKLKYKEVALNGSDYSWISTFWSLNENNVPRDVLSGFNSSEYGVNEVDTIRAMQDSEGLFYLFYFRDINNSHKHTVVTMNDDGSIKVVLSY